MNAAAVPAPDVSDAALELVALEGLAPKNDSELPTVAPDQGKSEDISSSDAPESSSLCSRLCLRPWRSPLLYFTRLHKEFGGSLLLCLMSNYLFLKGAAYHMAIAASTPVFREVLKLPAEKHSVATALFMIPWSVKGIVGSVSDLFALGGYHKRSYMLLASSSGVIGSILLIATAGRLTMGIAVAGFFLIMVQASFNDLLCEGGLGGARCGSSSFSNRSGALSAALCPAALSACLALAFQGLANTRRSEHGRLFACALCLTVCAFGSMIAGLLSDKMHVVGISYWFCSGVCITATVVCTMPAHLAKPVLYMFLGRMLVPNISSQFSYWLRAGPDCVVDGPQFSWSYLLTWNALAQSIFAFVGVALFQRFVSRWTFRRAFLVTSVLQQMTCILDIAMVMRWNRKIGIPDKAWYFCSASIIEEVASMWAFMPGCVLISRLCPKDIESTMYAVVAGLQNFAQSMSKLSGNFLCFTLLGIRTLATTEGTKCEFSNLPLAIGLAMGVCPFLPISLTFWLVPNIFMDQAVTPATTTRTAQAPAENAQEHAAAAAAAALPDSDAVAAAAADIEQHGGAASTEAPPSGVTEAADEAATPPASASDDGRAAAAAELDEAAKVAAAAEAGIAPAPADEATPNPEPAAAGVTPPEEAAAQAAQSPAATPASENGQDDNAAAAAAVAVGGGGTREGEAEQQQQQ
ncbi:folate/methotrexate transporter FT1, putative [Eimeria acervulina]|uniref:Folate/methotrexate transporter FT1, putative n=1 Tax=Eimeria acervulina TaxID=5801 RepID=U6GCU0_EIMAC|nr:folate/methotrexate transporter FT1, putative [Eimeria acervulina]CDI78051.1 folate/methotrexate transporter FT1, putative [Eimeria acervulina]